MDANDQASDSSGLCTWPTCEGGRRKSSAVRSWRWHRFQGSTSAWPLALFHLDKLEANLLNFFQLLALAPVATFINPSGLVPYGVGRQEPYGPLLHFLHSAAFLLPEVHSLGGSSRAVAVLYPWRIFSPP